MLSLTSLVSKPIHHRIIPPLTPNPRQAFLFLQYSPPSRDLCSGNNPRPPRQHTPGTSINATRSQNNAGTQQPAATIRQQPSGTGDTQKYLEPVGSDAPSIDGLRTLNYTSLVLALLGLAGLIGAASNTAQAQTQSPNTPQTGTIHGVARDADGQPLKDACVLLCDGPTGYPLVGDNYETVVLHFQKNRRFADKYIFAISDDDGLFRLHNVPYGNYRVVAQAWINPAKPVDNPMDHYGTDVLFLGAENVTLDARSSRKLTMRPRGTGVLKLNEKCGNSATWFMLSTAPTRADPVLGPIGWGGDFFRNFIGWNVMPLGDTNVHGLPAGKVHFALFAPDNVPGFGAGSATVQEGRTAWGSAPFVARWSDGIHDPPRRLRPLFATVSRLVAGEKFDAKQFLAKSLGLPARIDIGEPLKIDEFVDKLEKQITLPDGTRTTVADLMAVDGYLAIQKSVAGRQARNKPRETAPETPPDDASEFRKQLTALHAHLGRSYAGFGIKNIDWNAVGAELLPLADNITTRDQYGLLVLQIVARLEDSHAYVAPVSGRLPTIEFPRWDAGFACLLDDRDKPVVYHVDPGGPAAEAGIQKGMTVVAVDGVAAEDLIQRAMTRAAKYKGWSSRRYLRYQAARWFHQSLERGAEVTFEVVHAEGQTQTISTQSMLDRRYLPRLPVPIRGIRDSGNVSWKQLGDGIGYIYVRRIRNDLIESLDKAVRDLQGSRGLIIDVRGNSGGGFDAARAHRNFNSEDGREPSRPRYVGPMAVLIDSRCISAGEGWASWFQANKRTRFFGTATAGASSRKTTYELPDKLFEVTYSVKWYRGFLDRPIERRGLEPDEEVRASAQDIAAGRDTVLEKAKSWLLSVKPDE